MKIWKGVGKALFWLLILALLATPLALIFQLSAAELAEYEVALPPVIHDAAYGNVIQASRTDMAEYTTISGTFVSSAYAYQELDYRSPNLIRWEAAVGDPIVEGQTIGYYDDEPILAAHTGIIRQVQTYAENAYLQVQLLEPLELECKVPDRVKSVLSRSKDSLTTEGGAAVQILYQSPIQNSDGTTTLRLAIGGMAGTFGQSLKDEKLYTGHVYQNALVLDVDCVYQKERGEDAPWFVREVDAGGSFLREVEVKLGYSDGRLVCVSGVEEGAYFDDGYKAVVEGDLS